MYNTSRQEDVGMLVLTPRYNFMNAIQQGALYNLDWKVHPAKECPRTSAHTQTPNPTFFLLSTPYSRVSKSQLPLPAQDSGRLAEPVSHLQNTSTARYRTLLLSRLVKMDSMVSAPPNLYTSMAGLTLCLAANSSISSCCAFDATRVECIWNPSQNML